jgi:hypothetical protein
MCVYVCFISYAHTFVGTAEKHGGTPLNVKHDHKINRPSNCVREPERQEQMSRKIQVARH